MNAHLSLSTNVLLAPGRAGLCAGQDNTVAVLVRIQAPEAPPNAGAVQRPPQALALVLDRSSSMLGRPLQEAKRCVDHVLGTLRPTDVAAMVAFDDTVQQLWPAQPLGSGSLQRAALASVALGSLTNLHGGWQAGAEALAEVAGQGLKRVILLSDGQANVGLTDPAQISAQCAAMAGRGITTSTYGLGRKFNEELMVAMARAGGGNHYYGDTADDLMGPFCQELELLGDLCLRNLRLKATVPDGFSVEAVNPLPLTDAGWHLPDLAWASEAWVVLRVTMPAAALPLVGQQCTLLRVAVTGQSLAGEAVALERTGLALPVTAPATWGLLPEDELVNRRLLELEAGQALLDMRHAASAGDWARVDALLETAQQRFAGNDWVAAVLEAMRATARQRDRERVMKEMTYSSHKLSIRLAEIDEGKHLPRDLSTVRSYMRRPSLQGKSDV